MKHSIKHWFGAGLIGVHFFISVMVPAAAQTSAQEKSMSGASGIQDEVVSYPVAFFQRYQPNTAFDMVRQVPGFQFDDGSNLRGFSGAAGNVLINHRRPSAKQDSLSAILTRIPASYVARIDLLRGQVQGVDLQGQSVIANIILLADAPAAIRWDATVRRNFNNPQFGPDLKVSLSDRWMDIDYNAGFSLAANPRSYTGPEYVYDGAGSLIEQRAEDFFRDSNSGAVNLGASKDLGETLVRLNSKLGFANQDGLTTSDEVPIATNTSNQNELFGNDSTTRDFEIGLDAERNLSRNIAGKAIMLFYARNNDRDTDQRIVDATSEQTLFYREANNETRAREAIGRLELDWTGKSNHTVQANLELAYNSLKGSLLQIEDSGTGPVVIDVPGANTRVEEIRWDALLQDTWSRAELVLNYGIGVERSSISSEGDDERKRNFFYLKPQGQMTWSPVQGHQLRLRVAREVAQLDFNDFISTSEFEDDDLALGNTSLVPERVWVTELSYEYRYGDLGVVTLTGFYHRISDVQDLLPLTSEFEVPGNLGTGRRLGLEMETTIPLQWLGLNGARLDIKARWEDSSVTDPVTGTKRVLSGKTGFGGPTAIPFRDDSDEYQYVYDIAYRQDFNTARLAWGWDIGERAQRYLFKVNELDIVDEGELEFNGFVETTRFGNIKVRFEAQNILNLAETRDRTIFVNTRNLAGDNLERREVRARTKGFRLFFILSGTY